LFLPRELPELIGADVAREGLQRLQPIAHIAATLTDLPTGKAYAQVATLESALYMRNQLLRDTDWASMAHSLEVRTPLVDATLLQGLVGPLGASNLSSYKHFLAASPTTPLPDEVARRAKSGFTTPVSNWQQRSDGTQAWRLKGSLAMPSCPWARRWSYVVASTQNGLGL
jgi:asparagine synthase (glutamine-hydrolysing)